MTQVDPAFYAAGIVLPGPTSAANATGQIAVWNASGFDAWIGTWDLTSLTLPQTIIRNSLAVGASVLLNGQSLIYPGTDYNMDLTVQTTYTDGSVSNVGTWLDAVADPAADSPSFPSNIRGQYALNVSATTKSTNTKNINAVYGAWLEGTHQGSGILNHLYGCFNYVQAYSGKTVNTTYAVKNETYGGIDAYGEFNQVRKNSSYGVVQAGNAYGCKSDVANTEAISSGTDKNYGFWSWVIRTGATGGTLHTYGYWSQITADNAGAGTHNTYDFYANARSGVTAGDNDYYLWFGTQGTTTGVYRIKTDGVMAYYNPDFATAYTPGETNYERIVQQWNGSNVAQYGVEAGGTGTLRGLQLLGAYILVGGSTAAGEIRILEASGDGAHYVGLKSQAMSSSHTITLPAADGTNGQFLKTNGSGVWSFATISGGGDALTTNPLSQFAATTSAQLAGVISDETGSGALVFANTPTLVTPVLGVATATSINKVALTAPATGSTLTIADGATLTVSASATISNGTHSGTNTGDQTNITGNAATVTVADAGGDTTTWVLLGTTQTGSLTPATDAGLTYNATTNALTATTFVGALTGDVTGNVSGSSGSCTGNSATVTTNANLTGHVTSTGNAAVLGSFTIAQLNTAVSDADIQPSVSPTFTGRATFTATTQAWVDDSDGATITFDLAGGNYHRVTLAGNRTLALSNATAGGQAFILKLTQDATGSRTVTWFSGISWAGGAAPTLTTTASKSDTLGFIRTGSNTYDGFVVGQNI